MGKPNYRSKFERSIGANLTKRGIKFLFEPFKMTYFLKKRGARCMDCGSKNCLEKHSYLPDFQLGNGIIIEAKGHFTSKMRSKMIAVVKHNPDEDVRLLFMRNNFLTKQRKHTYGEWADKYGIIWAVGTKVPEEWTKEC